jgi:hypothetical protein
MVTSLTDLNDKTRIKVIYMVKSLNPNFYILKDKIKIISNFKNVNYNGSRNKIMVLLIKTKIGRLGGVLVAQSPHQKIRGKSSDQSCHHQKMASSFF